MKDPSDDIRQWVYDVLYGVVQYEGTYIPVYSFAPKDILTEPPRQVVIIGEQYMTGEGESTKDSHITSHSIEIEVYASFAGNDASYKEVNGIANHICEIIRQEVIEDQGSAGQTIEGFDDYNIIRINIDSMSTQRFLSENMIIILKTITVTFLIEELEE